MPWLMSQRLFNTAGVADRGAAGQRRSRRSRDAERRHQRSAGDPAAEEVSL